VFSAQSVGSAQSTTSLEPDDGTRQPEAHLLGTALDNMLPVGFCCCWL
jgi:hypothetical protein